MRKHTRLSRKTVLFTLTGLALFGLGTPAVRAQDTDDETYPINVGYPAAPPGGINLLHYTDFFKSDYAAGSSNDILWQKRRTEDEKWRQKGFVYNESGLQPSPFPIGYPLAPPGGIDLIHFTDFFQTDIAGGSTSDVMYRMRRETDEQWRQKGYVYHEGDVVAWPVPIGYPLAAPGGIDLTHFTDFFQTDIAPGSAEDAIYKIRREQDEKLMALLGPRK